MTTQEAYERMRIYLTRPGARRAWHPDVGGCGYEMQIEGENHRCAVGCLLSPTAMDDLEKKDMLFGTGVENLFHESMAAKRDLLGADPSFLTLAQNIHDSPKNWGPDGIGFDPERLDALAHAIELTVVVDEPEGAPQPVVEREAVPA